TPLWTKYRGSDHKKVLGRAIRDGYAELYNVYDDAHQRGNGELTHVFSTTSTAGAQSIAKTVATFNALVAEAEIDQNSGTDGDQMAASDKQSETVNVPRVPQTTPAENELGGTSLHLNIQIHISPEASTDQVEAIFASMAKHLYNRTQK